MKRKMSNSLAFLTMLGVLAAQGIAQDGGTRVRINQSETQVQTDQIDSKTIGSVIRASELTGMNIESPEGESLGEINDLVLDVRTGKVQYAAVTYGGFLGIGDKMFAVPFEAFQWRRDKDDADDYHLVLTVTKQQMEGAVGFDQDRWPNFADENFTRDLDRRYNIDRRQRNRDRGVGVRVDGNGVDVDVVPDRNRSQNLKPIRDRNP
jgi:sporulation protein YlmC with PRC-barrel domain